MYLFALAALELQEAAVPERELKNYTRRGKHGKR
jgi:hypothetical protein